MTSGRLLPFYVNYDPDEDLSWQQRGACRGVDPAMFFPPQGGSYRPALEICATCTVADVCLAHALNHHEKSGVWGNTTARQRRRIWARRKAAA